MCGGLQPWFATADLTPLQTLWGPEGRDADRVQAWPDAGKAPQTMLLWLGGDAWADRLSGSKAVIGSLAWAATTGSLADRATVVWLLAKEPIS
jgi:hypothetical protein